MATGAIIAAAVMGLSSILSINQQSHQAHDQQVAINEQLAARQKALEANKSVQANKVQMRQWAQQGRIRAAAADSGISLGSGSVEAELMSNLFQGGFDIGNINKSQSMSELANYTTAMSARNSIYNPNDLAAALQIGAAGAQGYMSAGGKFH